MTTTLPDLSSGVFTDTPSRDVAVSVRGLSKSYSIAKNAVQHTSIGEAMMHKLRHPFEKIERDTFWALNDVSFDIQKGDVVGIIGRNGAGKSTLLKILSRITEPTKGRIDLYGRVGSLLEVGTGFHPELTGRENIYLNGAILGMQKSEIARQFDAIVDFSGTAQFLDTPVKRYSSGMYVRLAFAVAAHLNPEILIVDEVLAVGDAEFQKKCLGKMQDVADSGRTVLFVSHNLTAIASLCDHGLLMQSGRVICDAPMLECTQAYTTSLRENTQRQTKLSSDDFGFSQSYLVNINEPDQDAISAVYANGRYSLNLECILPPSNSLNVGFTIVNDAEVAVASCSVRDSLTKIPEGQVTFQITLPVDILPSAEYRIEAAIWDGSKVYEKSDGLLFFTVVSANALDVQGGKPRGATLITSPWRVKVSS